MEGIFVTVLKKIVHPKGNILHCMKKSDPGFSGFGEAYFSTIKFNEIKGWNFHHNITLNLVVPIGETVFVIFDTREGSLTQNQFFSVILSENNYCRLTIPPKLWFAFKGKRDPVSYILNLANLEHDTTEIERMTLNQIKYNWNSV